MSNSSSGPFTDEPPCLAIDYSKPIQANLQVNQRNLRRLLHGLFNLEQQYLSHGNPWHQPDQPSLQWYIQPFANVHSNNLQNSFMCELQSQPSSSEEAEKYGEPYLLE